MTLAAAATLPSPQLASTTTFPQALAKPTCGSGALPETDIDGRVPASDYTSGRYRAGYRCNTAQVSNQGATGGFKSSGTSTPAVVCASST